MPRAIFNSEDELIAIMAAPSSPVDAYKTVTHVGTVLREDHKNLPRWYWRYITQVEFETYQVFGIREIISPEV